MYTPNQILSGLKDPKLTIFELLKIANKRRAINITQKDWDNLIILDACRYDLFEEVNTLPGELTRGRSLGSKTGEFLKENFGDSQYPDTVYISANPQVQLHDIDRRFYDRIRLWEDEWDDELRTVPPEAVVTRTLQASEKYPHKRLIIHFVQPHYPFIGETGRQIKHGEMIGDGLIADERTAPTIWERLEKGEIERSIAWKAYRENLELTLPHLKRLIDGLNGKSIVTSDHGNAFGEWDIFGHPASRHIKSLVEVPWLEIMTDERKEIREGEIEPTTDETSELQDRLAHLGYR
jgi:hypothetical protein